MTDSYNAVEVERLVEIVKQLAVNADCAASSDVMISKTSLIAIIDQLEAAQGEIKRITERDLFRRDCEWFIATNPEPWRIGRADFPRCENQANCVGETFPRRSQYVLCREHAEQWDGDLVAMSGEAIAIPKALSQDRDTLRSELDASRSEIESARSLLRASPAETLQQAIERVGRSIR